MNKTQPQKKLQNHRDSLWSRNFIGNANKFCKSKIFINLKSNNEFTTVTIEDDGDGYPNDIISKIGEPYLRSIAFSNKQKLGLGLGIFIGKTLLEKTLHQWNAGILKQELVQKLL